MAKAKKVTPLKKELTLLETYSIATGSTIAGGFFLLPGIAAAQAGESFVFAYVLAALLLIPFMLSKTELSTAMPRAGGVYYFLDRSLGPMIGTIGGIGVWLVLILKVSFALIGIGAYLSLFVESINIGLIAICIALILGFINIFGAKKSGKVQVIIVSGLLIILSGFIIDGFTEIHTEHLANLINIDISSLEATTGLVFVSYIGITKVASLSEEIQKPERNIPLSIYMASFTAFVIYTLGTLVILGVVPMDKLAGNLTAAATAAEEILGTAGLILISAAAFLSFVSVANAGILSASRYPLAMSRDHIFSTIFRKVNVYGTPIISLAVTVGVIVICLILFDPTKIAKLASAFQLLIFAFICLAVIIMRESKITSYDPGYKAPLYPWLQIFGIISAFYLIIKMGTLPIIFSASLIALSSMWYWFYARFRVERQGAIYHIFERLGRQRFDGLDSELRGILKEKGLRKGDPFDEIVLRSKVYDYEELKRFEEVVLDVSEWLSSILPLSSKQVVDRIMEGTRIGATPVTHGVALPHFRCDGIDHPEMVLVRSSKGISIPIFNPLNHQEEAEETVSAIFFLISPEKDPTQHLRILAQIAGRVDDESFMTEWKSSKDEQELKECMLHDEGFHSMFINHVDKTKDLIGKALFEIKLPENCLVALLRRDNNIIVPNGKTIIEEGDRLTIIGDSKSISEIRATYN
jgi:APA family basic amino acid/polyamine antiporter